MEVLDAPILGCRTCPDARRAGPAPPPTPCRRQGRCARRDPPYGRLADRHDPRRRAQPLPCVVEPPRRVRAALARRTAGRGSAVRVLGARGLLPADRGLPALPPPHDRPRRYGMEILTGLDCRAPRGGGGNARLHPRARPGPLG